MECTLPESKLADAWTDAKSASIDWTDPEDVLCNDWTFLRIMGFHPALAKYAESHLDEKEHWRVIFMNPSCIEERKKALQWWHQNGLLSLREERWCRHCGGEGHTRRSCDQLRTVNSNNDNNNNDGNGNGNDHTKTGSSRIMSRFLAHQAEIERCKLLREKQSKEGAANPLARANGAERLPPSRRGDNNYAARPNAKKELTLFADERRRGSVGRIDVNYGIGFVRVSDVGDVKFFMDRVDYGVKEIAVGDAVTLKIDQSREYPIAVDIRPEMSNITLEDVQKFLKRCKTTTQPINVIKTLMTHTHGWNAVLGIVRDMAPPAFIDGVHTLVELTTFVGNREPIHIPLLESFLSLMLRNTSKTDVTPFFPTMVRDALVKTGELKLEDEIPWMVDRWMEVVNLTVLLRHYTNCTTEVTGEVESILTSLLTASQNSTVTLANNKKSEEEEEEGGTTSSTAAAAAAAAAAAKRKMKIDGALRRLQSQQWEKEEHAMLLIPTADEFNIPPPDPRSVFKPQNLPVNGAIVYNSTKTYITDQCRLLRADTFESVSRILPAVCYKLPHYRPTADTEKELPHVRLFSGVRFMGRVITRDKDYASPESYILQVQPKSPLADVSSQLLPGTTVCITTALDHSVISSDELFWGIITSCNAQFLAGGVIVLAPLDSNVNFDLLIDRLRRNEQLGKTDHSCMLATSIFMMGYKSIMKALGAFLGPLAMQLPLASTLVSKEAVVNSTASHSGKYKIKNPHDLVSYIPPHCEPAFLDLIDMVNEKFDLDEGQKEVMRSLPTSDILLVQGPPGTGKSFIGCRVVEVYIRYKQLVASGDILRTIDVDQLRSSSEKDLFPTVGPIVVITYKNHALDEFLIDLLKSGLWDDERPRIVQQFINGSSAGESEFFPRGKRIVRIGGRSREPILDAYNLGTLLRTKTDKATLNSLKERLFLMNQRLERLLKEIHYLESGRVPKSLFERWLTEEQRKSLRYEDRDEWLQGKQYVGTSTRTAERTLYLDLLRTQLAACLDEVQRRPAVDVGASNSAEAADDDGGAPLSVFQEMRREEENRDFNNALPFIYLSAEAMELAKNPPTRPDDVPDELLSLWSLDPVLRHEYYAFLIRDCISAKARDCQLIIDAIVNIVTIRNHAMDEVKLGLLQGADVVGLTTTGCARNQNLLRSLRPSVLVVEEAAEVLESQLLACMTDSLQQIVLVGDHYQLQPKVETFAYEKFNKLNISLFERLATRMKPICLTEQRRMHPLISRMVRPFYNERALMDNPGLSTRPFISASGTKYVDCIPGLAKRVFFWRHRHPEESSDGCSKVNIKEVEMVLKIVVHLTSEGVHQKSITIITPYIGQCQLLRTKLRLRAFSDVAVNTVDLFQGDENDIVILSLVRTEHLTEFLRMRNRMIVSCSRARFATVMVGNDTLLQQSEHWKQVLDMLQEENCVDDRLPITSRTSPGETLWLEA